MSASAASGTSIASAVAMRRSCSAIALAEMRLELEHLRARQDRVGNLVQLGRRHHEDDVGRRFLDRLQQRVERRRRELMHFVDDEDLVAVAHRSNRQPGDDHLADVVDAGVAGRVDLEHVDVAPLRDLDAGIALTAGIGRRPLHAVQRRGEDARRGGLAAAARSGEHEGLRDPAAASARCAACASPPAVRRRRRTAGVAICGQEPGRTFLQTETEDRETEKRSGSHRDPVHLRHTAGST